MNRVLCGFRQRKMLLGRASAVPAGMVHISKVEETVFARRDAEEVPVLKQCSGEEGRVEADVLWRQFEFTVDFRIGVGSGCAG